MSDGGVATTSVNVTSTISLVKLPVSRSGSFNAGERCLVKCLHKKYVVCRVGQGVLTGRKFVVAAGSDMLVTNWFSDLQSGLG